MIPIAFDQIHATGCIFKILATTTIKKKSQNNLRLQLNDTRSDRCKHLILHYVIIPVRRSSSFWTHLVDDDEDGVDEHQVVLLQGQVVGLLQGEQHRPYQGDLGGAKTNALDTLGPALGGTPNIRHQTQQGV